MVFFMVGEVKNNKNSELFEHFHEVLRNFIFREKIYIRAFSSNQVKYNMLKFPLPIFFISLCTKICNRIDLKSQFQQIDSKRSIITF
jgi:hypothetical protein